MGARFDFFFLAKELHSHLKKVEDRTSLFFKKLHDALSMEGFQEKKLRRAGESPEESSVFYKNN